MIDTRPDGLRRVRLGCEHQGLTAIVLPGRRPLDDRIVVDILRTRLGQPVGCDCDGPQTRLESDAARPEPGRSVAHAAASGADA